MLHSSISYPFAINEISGIWSLLVILYINCWAICNTFNTFMSFIRSMYFIWGFLYTVIRIQTYRLTKKNIHQEKCIAAIWFFVWVAWHRVASIYSKIDSSTPHSNIAKCRIKPFLAVPNSCRVKWACAMPKPLFFQRCLNRIIFPFFLECLLWILVIFPLILVLNPPNFIDLVGCTSLFELS